MYTDPPAVVMRRLAIIHRREVERRVLHVPGSILIALDGTSDPR